MVSLLKLFLNKKEFLIEALIARLEGVEAVFVPEDVLDGEPLLTGIAGAVPVLQVFIHVDIVPATLRSQNGGVIDGLSS